MKPVIVRWTDAQTVSTSLISIEEAKEFELTEAETIGFLFYQDKKKTIIAHEAWPSEKSVKYLHIIPTSLVKEIIILKEARSKK